MLSTIEKLADRLLLVIAPKADAGACPCPTGYYCSRTKCGPASSNTTAKFREYCDCQRVYVGCSCN